MVDLARRTFLIGTAAAIVAAKMPRSVKLVTQAQYEMRALAGISIVHDISEAAKVANLEIWRGPEKLLDFPLPAGGYVHWRAPPGYDLLFARNEALWMRSSLGQPTSIEMLFTDINGSRESRVAERYTRTADGGYSLEAFPVESIGGGSA